MGDGGPDLLQVFAQRDSLAAGFFHSGVAGENFERGAKTGENGVRTDNAFLGEPGHPFVDAPGQLDEHVAPIADLLGTQRAIGGFAGPDYNVDR